MNTLIHKDFYKLYKAQNMTAIWIEKRLHWKSNEFKQNLEKLSKELFSNEMPIHRNLFAEFIPIYLFLFPIEIFENDQICWKTNLNRSF